ncbi:MAG: DNA cytosine methyltransferase [Thermodesulfobacteriota bacterium]
MKCLDLFCGAGGAAKGLNEAGFDIVGIDIDNQPEFPFEFIQCDVFNLTTEFLQEYDLIWASPPCQGFIPGTIHARNKGKIYPNLIPHTRQLLKNSWMPFVIENVQCSPVRKDLMLCGQMFDLKILRHRFFEIEGFHVPRIKHFKHKLNVQEGTAIGVYTGMADPRKVSSKTGHLNEDIETWQKALEVNWVKNRKNLAQCIPPKYSKYIGSYFN